MSNPDLMYDEANARKDQGDLEGAVTKLQEILEVDADHLQTHLALGVHLAKLGRFQEAVVHARRVTELDPNDVFSWTQLSVVLMRCNLIPEAEEAKAIAHHVQAGGTPPQPQQKTENETGS